MSMNEEVEKLFKKAENSLDAAHLLFEKGYYDFSASRSYYTMFYSAEAVLLTKDLSFSKHSSVVASFGKEFIKTEIFPQRLHKYLVDAFDVRNLGDYGAPGSVNKKKAEDLLEKSEEFLDEIKEHIERCR